MAMRLMRGGALAMLMLTAATSCGRGRRSAALSEARRGVLTISQEQQASWIRNFNPLLAPGGVRWPTTAGVYEPLLIYNTMKGEYVPWLATSYAWSAGNKRLTFTLRQGVQWSDGRPFRAADVAFTFALTRKHRALDLHTIWAYVESVEARDEATVELSFSRPYVPSLFHIGQQPIVPEHIWKDVADPVTFPNEHPVATGPFTEIKVFQNQVYELGRNPHYWQAGKPALSGLRFPAYPGNDQANLALIGGEADWAGNFVPDIDRVFVKRAPADYHYWFPLVAGTVFLYTNTTKAPFNDVRLRKAVSMAIDRAQIVKVAMYDYTRPSDATGLCDAYARWRSESAVAAGDWVKHDMARAERLLDEAGYPRGEGGVRQGPGGAPLKLDVNVVTGWSDWVRAAQIVTQNLRRVGVAATLKAYDFSAYFEKLQKGDFDLSMGWSIEGPTPYSFYFELMASQTAKPVGQLAATNWNRFTSTEADALFHEFEATDDPEVQRRLQDRMQMLFVENAPSIPLFPNPSWGEFSTARFEGFPDKANPYAKLSPNNPPEYLLVLTELRPK